MSLVGSNCKVFKNEIPKQYIDYECFSGLYAEDRSRDVIRMEPRIGAFEIFYEGFVSVGVKQCLFSKLKNGLWPRISLVARKVATIVDKVQRHEDVSSLLSPKSAAGDLSPKSSLTRSQTSSQRFPSSNSNYGTSSRSKFVKSYAQGFYSPQNASRKVRIASNQKGSQFSPVMGNNKQKRTVSSKDLYTQMSPSLPTDGPEDKDALNEVFSNPQILPRDFVRGDQESIEDENQVRKEEAPPIPPPRDEKAQPKARAAAPNFQINILRSGDQQLFLFGKHHHENKHDRTIPQISQGQEHQELEHHNIPSHNTSLPPDPDISHQQMKQGPPSPKSTYREMENVAQEVDYQGGYLSEASRQGTPTGSGKPQVFVNESGNQPLYYWGDSEQGGMPKSIKIVDQNQKLEKLDEQEDQDDENYDPPTPVAVRLQESPDQGVLFDQINQARGGLQIKPLSLGQEQEQPSEDYQDASFENS